MIVSILKFLFVIKIIIALSNINQFFLEIDLVLTIINIILLIIVFIDGTMETMCLYEI